MAKWKPEKKRNILNKTGGRCAYCGCPLTLKSMTVDHIIPKIEGGSNDISNLNPSCQRCNFMKGRLSVIDFVIGVKNIMQKIEKDNINTARKHKAKIKSTRDCILYYKKLTDINKPGNTIAC